MKPPYPHPIEEFKDMIKELTPREMDRLMISYNHNYLGAVGKKCRSAIHGEKLRRDAELKGGIAP